MKKITIAIDGYSSCGKSTMAKDLAREIGYIYVDSGAMYRAITLFAIENNLFSEDSQIDSEKLCVLLPGIDVSFRLSEETGLPQTYLNDRCVEKEIRSMAVSSRVSPIAALPCVREKLTLLQRQMGLKKGIVMDGRDIGTSVFPNAELKIFVTASVEIRAKRRFDELKSKGMETPLEEICRNVEERDYIDTHRETSPLSKASDAVELDNSFMTIDEQKHWLISLYEERASISD